MESRRRAVWMYPQGTLAATAGVLTRRSVMLHINGDDVVSLPDFGYGAAQPRAGVAEDDLRGGARDPADRFEPRDYIDLHFILSRVATDCAAPDQDEVRRRFRKLLNDLQRIDPGLNETHVGQVLARGLGQPIVSAFPLRLLVAVTEEAVQRSLAAAHEECARIAAGRMQGRID